MRISYLWRVIAGKRCLSCCVRPCCSQLQDCELRMRSVAKDRAAQLEAATVDGDDDGDDGDDGGSGERYVVQRTGAFVTEAAAVAKLNNVASRIPRDRYTEPWQPEYIFSAAAAANGPFECTVALPQKSKAFVGVGPSKRAAKRVAALRAVAELHRCGLLDDHLKPLSAVVSREDAVDRHGRGQGEDDDEEDGGLGRRRQEPEATGVSEPRGGEKTPDALAPGEALPGAHRALAAGQARLPGRCRALNSSRSQMAALPSGTWHLHLLAPATADAAAEWTPIGILLRSPLPVDALPLLRLDDLQDGCR